MPSLLRLGRRAQGFPTGDPILTRPARYPFALTISVNSSSFLPAAPESIASSACLAPSRKSSAHPAATSAAAALITTTFRLAPRLPPSTARIISAFSAASPPAISSTGARSTSKSSGVTVKLRTSVPRTSATRVSPEIEISSSPSAPCTTNARSTPSAASAPATSSTPRSLNTPATCARAPAGFVSGPSRLNAVCPFSSLRALIACRIAECAAGAKKNPIPILSTASPIRSSGTSIRTPSASSTSADPARELIDRFPCFATRAPAPAATSAAHVEMLNVPRPSPPVPHVSTRPVIAPARPAANTGAACLRIAVASPTSSSTVSPFSRSALSNPLISSSAARPHKISSIAASASPRDKSFLRVTISRALKITGTPAACRCRAFPCRLVRFPAALILTPGKAT